MAAAADLAMVELFDGPSDEELVQLAAWSTTTSPSRLLKFVPARV